MGWEAIRVGLETWVWPGLYALVGVVVAAILYRLLLVLARRFIGPQYASRRFLDVAAKPLGFALCLLVLNGVLTGMKAEPPWLHSILQMSTLLMIIAFTWAAVRCASAVGDMIVHLNPASQEQWREARKIETQTRFLVRGLNILVVIVGAGSALMTFDSVQQLGTSLLASAGIGGIILGFAARPVLENLLAGVQIALTQPFRIDDVLSVQGEWCWVEEVTATYVVLRVWDQRRLVVPLQWFIENPFQNWTRATTDLVGGATLWVDYQMPLTPLREEFARLLQANPLWDGITQTVQVVEAGDRAQQIRFLVSAPDSTSLWHLRCDVREGMVHYMQQHYPQHLPRLRAELTGDGPFSANPQARPAADP